MDFKQFNWELTHMTPLTAMPDGLSLKQQKVWKERQAKCKVGKAKQDAYQKDRHGT